MTDSQKQCGITDSAATTIRRKARRLVGTVGFTTSDVQDLEQELRLDLMKRLHKFDPDRGSYNTFVARIIDHKIQNIIRHRKQEIRDFRRESYSINGSIEPSDGNSTKFSDLISQDDAEIRRGTRRRSRRDQAQLHLDVSLVVNKIPADLQQVAQLLSEKTVTETAKALGIPRTTLYGNIERLRQIFKNNGLNEYL